MTGSDRDSRKSAPPIPPPLSLAGYASLREEATFAYEWGWPMVNVAARARRMKRILRLFNADRLRIEGWPIGYNTFTMQIDRSSPDERLMCCPNSGLLYGGGAFELGTKGVVVQVPQELYDHGIKWIYSFYDARSLHFAGCASYYPTVAGFYLIVGPDWDTSIPPGIPNANVIHHKDATNLVFLTARIFVKPNEAGPWIQKVNMYPAPEFTGVEQSVDWENDVEDKPWPCKPRDDELRYVKPRKFFRNEWFPKLFREIKPLPGEAAQYRRIEDLLAKLDNNPLLWPIFLAAAVDTENTVIKNDMLWSQAGKYVGDGWYFSEHSGAWPPDEYNLRTANAKANLFQNRPEDTHYYCRDYDSNHKRLNGKNTYKITFEGGLPPAQGPWSVTVYNHNHFLYKDPYSYSDRDPDDDPGPALVVYAGPKRPKKKCNFIQAPPNEPFCLYLRAYWMDSTQLPWTPPTVVKQ